MLKPKPDTTQQQPPPSPVHHSTSQFLHLQLLSQFSLHFRSLGSSHFLWPQLCTKEDFFYIFILHFCVLYSKSLLSVSPPQTYWALVHCYLPDCSLCPSGYLPFSFQEVAEIKYSRQNICPIGISEKLRIKKWLHFRGYAFQFVSTLMVVLHSHQLKAIWKLWFSWS